MNKTIALRFADNFAPKEGTVQAHCDVIKKQGFVWYGKLGSGIASSIASAILDLDDPTILLIHSGSTERYWAHVEKIQRECPDKNAIPEYYRNKADKVGCWFKLTDIEPAAPNVMSKYVVVSSGKRLTEASRYSMSPYFIIAKEDEILT